MAEITASLVKTLRDATNVSMMECKRALVDSEGDLDLATKMLRERGIDVANKKASRAANQGLIAALVTDDSKTASLIEINCETDFVARNETFLTFAADLAAKACETDGSLAEEVKEDITSKITELGENIVIKRNTRYVIEGPGLVATYVHLGGKVGVLLDVGCEKEETVSNDKFKVLAKDLTLHIAAAAPTHLTSANVPEDLIASEREIYASQVKDKPAEIIERIVDGKIRKFFGEICLLDQGFVKEPKQSITELLDATGKEVDDKITVRRFERYQLGE